MTARNPSLEAAIVDEPESADAYLVYGDWLLEEGDPLGELVTIQAKLAKLDTRAGHAKEKSTLRKREKVLLLDAETRLGALASHEHTWSFGFLESLILSNPSAASYEAMLSAPAARFLRELDIEDLRRFSISTVPTHPTIAFLARLGVPPTLRKLALLADARARFELGELPSELWPRLASLRELTIRSGPFRPGAMSLPNLETLSLDAPLTNELLESLRTADLPRLVSLQLDAHIGVTGPRLQPLFERWTSEGTLRHFGASEHQAGDDVLRALLASGLVKQLRSLDLSRSEMTDSGGRLVLDRSDEFEHLESLNLSENDLSPSTTRALERRFDLVVDIEEQGPRDET